MIEYIVSLSDIVASYSVFLTRSLTLGILSTTTLEAEVVAKPVILSCLLF